MIPTPACELFALSAFMFSIAHWGKPIKGDLIAQALAAILLGAGLALL